MLELTGIASMLRGISMLYWALAFGLLALALWKGKGWKAKTLWVLLVFCVFGYFPVTGYIEHSKREAYAKKAWAYYKNLCATKSGEKIYKTFTGVKSVLVVKPLPPADENDLSNQFWLGDPYSSSHAGDRSVGAASILAAPTAVVAPVNGTGFDFVEIRREWINTTDFLRLSPNPKEPRETKQEYLKESASRFGISWEDISTPEDRKFWVARSRLRVTDLLSNEIVAERVGFYIEAGFGSLAGGRIPWRTSKGPNTTCPESHTWADRRFLTRVLTSTEKENQNGK